MMVKPDDLGVDLAPRHQDLEGRPSRQARAPAIKVADRGHNWSTN